MKTSISLFYGILVTSSALAQETIVTSAPTIEAVITRSSSDLNATLTQLLEEAKQQKEKLETSLQRMGEPKDVNLASVKLIKDDILASATSLKTKDEQREMMSTLTGAEVFDDDAFGVMEPIGATVTKEDGTVVDRDPERYRLESAMVAQVKEYKRVRQEALDRKEKLNAELADVIQDIEDAEDLASIQKLNAMVLALRGQIDECNQTIMISQADVEMTEKELVGQARVMSKAKQEEANINNQRDPDAPPVGGAFPGLGAPPKKLPWGRKGTTSGSGESAIP